MINECEKEFLRPFFLLLERVQKEIYSYCTAHHQDDYHRLITLFIHEYQGVEL